MDASRKIYLDSTVRSAQMYCEYKGMAPEEALNEAMAELNDLCEDIIGGTRKGEWTPAEVDQYREYAGVLADLRNRFVSPTLGNVYDWALAQIAP